MIRRIVLCAAAVALLLAGQSAASTVPFIATIDDGAAPVGNDSPMRTTITPNGDGYRDRAHIHVRVGVATTIHYIVRRGLPEPKTYVDKLIRLSPGTHTLVWSPPANAQPNEYRVTLKSGEVSRVLLVRLEGIDAAFGAASYAPGAVATLTIRSDAHRCTVRVFRVGSETTKLRSAHELRGTAVSRPIRLAPCRSRSGAAPLFVTIGDWASGFYFARIAAADGRVGFAPFLVGPRRLGEHRVAVVEPTFTWQAYNFRDEDGDGVGDTWYANWTRHWTNLRRPYLDRGVPPHFRWYDLQFLHWLVRHGHQPDFLADEDLDNVASGDALRSAYDLVIFPGHHEYVTAHEYDVVQRFRDLGGRLMFLSANNFFWRVDRVEATLHRVAKWRDLGRPEAGLVGVQYRGNDEGTRRGPYVVSQAPDWFLSGTGLTRGSTFGHYGIEIDARSAASPPTTVVLATIPRLFGPTFSAEMTLYRTPAGAEVFAAGAFTLGGSAQRPEVDTLLENLWEHMLPSD